MKKARRLRFHIFVPLALLFALLWFATMLMMSRIMEDEAEHRLQIQEMELGSWVVDQWSFYQNNLKRGLGDKAVHILTSNISGVRDSDHRMASAIVAGVRDQEGRIMVSQIARGYGHEEGVDQGQRWTLYFDQKLDDDGQVDLAQWLCDHVKSNTWAFTVWPDDSHGQGDGTIARVTGQELPGCAIAVEQIQLLHPNGSVETMVDTGVHSPDAVTMEFRYMMVTSLLQDSRLSVQRRDRYARELLACYHQALESLPVDVGGQDGHYGYHFFDSARGELGDPGYMVASSADIEGYVRTANWTRVLYSFLMTLATALFLSVSLSRKVREPVEALCRQVRQGKCAENGPIEEMNTLAVSFNEQQAKMEAQLQRERDFTRAAAHELKTPLAVLRTHAEALQEDILPEKRDHYFAVLLEETDRMSALVSRLLELSRLESGGAITHEVLDLTVLVREVFQNLALPLERKHMALTLDLDEVWIEGDKVRLREAISNLAANALRYGTEGGPVVVELKAGESKAVLSVTNDSPAIPEEALPHLFEPFYRVDKARSRADGGSGLGLAIVKAAVEAHGGRCGVENLSGAVRFRIELPND